MSVNQLRLIEPLYLKKNSRPELCLPRGHVLVNAYHIYNKYINTIGSTLHVTLTWVYRMELQLNYLNIISSFKVCINNM